MRSSKWVWESHTFQFMQEFWNMYRKAKDRRKLMQMVKGWSRFRVWTKKYSAN